jgi:1-acyl-sn-glycerol-3-phosphate acyltransferase
MSNDSSTAIALVSPSPKYRIPLRNFVQAGWYMALGKPRNLGHDFRYLAGKLPVAPVISGTQYLPASGPYVVVANHYERPGLWMGWSGMIAARVVYEHSERRLRWIAIAEWHDYKLAGIAVPPKLTRFLFDRFFRVFGFIAMEPPGATAAERAGGVRSALEAIRVGDAIGIFPEGNIGSTPAMIKAQQGSGAFLLGLHARSAPLIPLGLFEAGNRLHLRFGPPLDPSDVKVLPRAERDEAASTMAMTAVAALVPLDLRGAYGGEA